MSAIYSYEFWCTRLNDLENKLRKSRKTASDSEFEQLLEDIKEAKQKIKEFYPEYKKEIYKECDHLSAAIYTHYGYDRIRTYCKCLKCGLDDSVLSGMQGFPLPDYTAEEFNIMVDFFCENPDGYRGPGLFKGIKIISKEYEELKPIYDEMKKEDPNLTDYKFLTECEKRIGLDSFYSKDYIRIKKLHGIEIDVTTGKQIVRSKEK